MITQSWDAEIINVPEGTNLPYINDKSEEETVSEIAMVMLCTLNFCFGLSSQVFVPTLESYSNGDQILFLSCAALF